MKITTEWMKAHRLELKEILLGVYILARNNTISRYAMEILIWYGLVSESSLDDLRAIRSLCQSAEECPEVTDDELPF